MAGIRITKFGGMMPRVQPINLPGVMAVLAEDVNLDRNAIKPWRKPKKTDSKAGKAFIREKCCTIAHSNACADYAYDSIGCSFVYATGTHDYPVVATAEEACAGNWCRLGLPCEMTAPTVSAPVPVPFTLVTGDACVSEYVGSGDNKTLQTTVVTEQGYQANRNKRRLRTYVYTTVDKYGNEGQPSPPSRLIEVDTDQAVTVGLPTSFAGWCVEKIRIYRSEQELTYGDDQRTIDGDYFEVGEVTLGTAQYIDNGNSDVYDALTTQEYDPPPADLHSIQYSRFGQVSGITGDAVAFSFRHDHHAFPFKYRLHFHHKPLAWLAGDAVGYVMTDGAPAVVRYDTNDEVCHKTEEVQDSHPIASKRSAVLYNEHAIYASKDGLVMLAPNGAVRLLTADYYTREQWQELEPTTMHGAVHDGHYFAFFKNHAFRLRIPDGVYAQADETALTTLSLRPADAYAGSDDRLYLMFDDGVYQWNAADDFMTARWMSRISVMAAEVKFTAYKIHCDHADAVVTHIADRTEVVQHTVVNRKPRRLPLCARGLDWQVLIETTGEVTEYHLATSVRDLSEALTQ